MPHFAFVGSRSQRHGLCGSSCNSRCAACPLLKVAFRGILTSLMPALIALWSDPEAPAQSSPSPLVEISACVLACVGAGGRADEMPEVPVQLALIVEPDSRRDFARLHACCEELLRTHDAEPREVGMRW